MHFSFLDIESIFQDDIKNKKRETASMRAATNHKRLGKGRMKTPSDLMSRKDKKEHMKAGEVVTTNLFDDILTIAEFEALETHEQRNRLAYWRTKYSNKEIMNKMGNLNNAKFYKMVADLGLPKAIRTNGDKKPVRKAPIKKIEAPVEQPINSDLELDTQPLQRIIINGLNLEFNGTYAPETIIKQLLKFGALLEGEESDFYVELKLMQKG